MLTILTESRPKKQPIWRRLASNSVSLAVHAGLLFGAVFLTTKEIEPPVDDAWQTDIIIFPKSDANKRSHIEPIVGISEGIARIVSAPIEISTGITPVDVQSMFAVENFGKSFSTGVEFFGPYVHTPKNLEGVFDLVIVDEEPVRISSPPLDYPNTMRRAGIEGTVVIRAIVDTAGRVEAESMEVLRSDFSAFEGPALRLLRMSIFRPGRVGGVPVRVLIQIPIRFSLVER